MILEIKLLPISERAILIQPVLHFLNMRIVANGGSSIGIDWQTMGSGQDFITRVTTGIRVVVLTLAIRLSSQFVMPTQWKRVFLWILKSVAYLKSLSGVFPYSLCSLEKCQHGKGPLRLWKGTYFRWIEPEINYSLYCGHRCRIFVGCVGIRSFLGSSFGPR